MALLEGVCHGSIILGLSDDADPPVAATTASLSESEQEAGQLRLQACRPREHRFNNLSTYLTNAGWELSLADWRVGLAMVTALSPMAPRRVVDAEQRCQPSGRIAGTNALAFAA